MVVDTEPEILLRLEALARLLDGVTPAARKALVAGAVREYLASRTWDSSTG
jgi:hypothetical protein